MKSFVESRWFALSLLIVVGASGFSLYLWPQSWIWVLPVPIVMAILRLVERPASFQTPLWLVSLIIFLVTACIGYAVAYNEAMAWNKLSQLVVALLLYVAVSAQSVRNRKILAWIGLMIGTGVASVFLLTADFSALAVKFDWIHHLGLSWMAMRPSVFGLPSIHPNDTAGISIIAGAYGLPLLGSRRTGLVQKTIVLAGLAVILFAVLLASSRGAFLGLMGALGVWGAWQLWLRSSFNEKSSAWFPYIVMGGILVLEYVVLFVPSGLLGSSFQVSGNVFVSRADVFRSGLALLRDFPFTGGGLASFPGLYSQYIMVTPFYLLPHSHNMILNVTLEQGVFGGIAFILICFMGVRQLLSAPPNTSAQLWYLAACVSLFTAIFHGMVDDYLYETSGPTFALVPAGMAMLVYRIGATQRTMETQDAIRVPRRFSISPQYSVVAVSVVAALLALYWKPLAAQWFANRGAIEMARIELSDFPTGRWSEGEHLSRLESAERNFQQAVAYQPNNRTANHRLGLIRMAAMDYASASMYLQIAYGDDPSHRGVIKNLGYSYLWSGDMDRARMLLSKLPEAKYELGEYIWWWDKRQRTDLSERASQLAASMTVQP